MRAKVAQESLVTGSGMPYTILRATQFFEFVGAIADSATDGATVVLPACAFQPIAADVVAEFTDVATGAAGGAIVEIAGPDRGTMEGFVREYLTARGDPRAVTTAPGARYFGKAIGEALAPAGAARLGAVRFRQWLTS